MNKCLKCENEIAKNRKYCSLICANSSRKTSDETRRKLKEIASTNYENKFGKVVDFVVKCQKCNNDYVIQKRENVKLDLNKKYFCSRSCANSRNHSDETKQKISKSVRISSPKKDYGIKICPNCKKEFSTKSKSCSKSCSSKIKCNTIEFKEFMRSVALKTRERYKDIKRSKNEIYFSELCSNNFENVKTNEAIFNGWDADVIIEDIKYAVLWNGKWHYEKITEKHSVEQVQNRDRIKTKEIINCGYIPYVIKDMGRYNTKFVEEQFQIFLEYISKK
jgi:hypothetical protein